MFHGDDSPGSSGGGLLGERQGTTDGTEFVDAHAPLDVDWKEGRAEDAIQ